MLRIFLTLSFILSLLLCEAQTALKINDRESEDVRFLQAKEIASIMMKDGRFFDDNFGLSSDGVISEGEQLQLDEIALIEIKQVMLRDVLAAPFKWVGMFLAGAGTVLMVASLPDSNNDGEINLLAAGAVIGGAGVGLTALGIIFKPKSNARSVKTYGFKQYEFGMSYR